MQITKIIINLESDQHFPTTSGEANIAYAHIYECIVVHFYCYLLPNKKCHRNSLCTMMTQVMVFAFE